MCSQRLLLVQNSQIIFLRSMPARGHLSIPVVLCAPHPSSHTLSTCMRLFLGSLSLLHLLSSQFSTDIVEQVYQSRLQPFCVLQICTYFCNIGSGNMVSCSFPAVWQMGWPVLVMPSIHLELRFVQGER